MKTAVDTRWRSARLAGLALCIFSLRVFGAGLIPMAVGQAAPVPLRALLPPGYKVLADARVAIGPGFEVVALGRTDEGSVMRKTPAPARPLLIFQHRTGGLALIGRNDHIVLRADEGGQCDPFLDDGAPIAVKGRFFTVQNGVACGDHWTDYITFRYDDHAGFVFDNERMESLIFNRNGSENADALVPGPGQVRRAKPGQQTSFARWRPSK